MCHEIHKLGYWEFGPLGGVTERGHNLGVEFGSGNKKLEMVVENSDMGSQGSEYFEPKETKFGFRIDN